MQRIGGIRRKTRHLYTISQRKKGKVSITKYIQTFKIGEKVKILFNSMVSRSQIKPRHYGKTGIISRQRGDCYEVSIKDNKKDKVLIIHPIHLVKLNG